MPRRMYNEYDDMDMIEMERRGGSQGQRGGRGGRSGGQGGNRGVQGGRGGRGVQNAYPMYPYMPPYSEYDDDDDWEDEDDMEMYSPYNEMEMRRGRSRGRGRRRDSRGRFTSMMEQEGYYPNGPYMGNKQKIGFNSNQSGASSSEYFDEEELMYLLEELPDEIPERQGEIWMKGLINNDGSKGPHWNREQLSKVYKESKVEEKTKGEVSEEDFYYTMNMIYSDYCKVFKENNLNSIKAYVDFAIAFLIDEDATRNKLVKYFYCITDSE